MSLLLQSCNLLIEGPPAVGKSLIARRLAQAVTGEFPGERVEAVQFHPAYGFEDFVHGYRPGPQGPELRDGIFTRFCREALKDPQRPYVFIIDELNRANPAAVFGELLTLLEPDKRHADYAMPLLHARLEGERFYVPRNVHIVATANSVDPLLQIDSGVRRRFATATLKPAFRSSAFLAHLQKAGFSKELAKQVSRTMQRINDEIRKHCPGPDAPVIGHGFFSTAPGTPGKAEEWLRRVLKHYVVPQIESRWKHDPQFLHRLLQELTKAGWDH